MPVPDKFIAIGVNGRAPALIYEYNVVPCRQNRRIQEAGQGPPTPTPETRRCKNVKIKIKNVKKRKNLTKIKNVCKRDKKRYLFLV